MAVASVASIAAVSLLASVARAGAQVERFEGVAVAGLASMLTSPVCPWAVSLSWAKASQTWS